MSKKEKKEEKSAAFSLTEKPKIVVQGANYRDGMGDIGHILNLGGALAEKYPAYQILYRIMWKLRSTLVRSPTEGDFIFDRKRLHQLADMLFYLKYIPAIPEIFSKKEATLEALIEALEKASQGVIFLFTCEQYSTISTNKSLEEKLYKPFTKAKLYIDVSTPFIFEDMPGSLTKEGEEFLASFGSPR